MSDVVPQDFVDMVAALRAAGAEFLVVGAHALAAHGVVRATGDLDLLVRPENANAERVLRALRAFGAPIDAHGVAVRDFATPGTIYQIGLPPRRIDILTSLTAVDYDDALVGAVDVHLGKEVVRCIGRAAFVRNKQATGRTKDLADVEALEAIAARRR